MPVRNDQDPDAWDRKIRIVRFLDRVFRKCAAVMLTAAAVITGAAAYDMYTFTMAGIKTVEYHGFEELKAVNPDTAAWIRINGTNIDHPVVQGDDNYEYLDKDFYGNDYAGGCIFLDEQNSKDLSDSYIIIHGHHMAGGAMFGDLGRFLNRDFFDEHPDGELLTEDSIYKLDIAGAAKADAYDSSVYYTGPDYMPEGLTEMCVIRRDLSFDEGDKLIALSTCSGEMNNNRILLFARARYQGENDVQHDSQK